MFGFDDRDLDKIRRHKPVRWWLVGLELSLLLPVFVWATLLYAVSTPEGLNLLLDRLLAKSPLAITAEQVTLTPASKLHDPRTWQVMATGVRMAQADPTKPVITANKVLLGLPDPVRIAREGRVHWSEITIIDLHVAMPNQQPAPPWEERTPKVYLLSADVVNIWGASYRAAPDGTLPEARMDGIWGTATNLQYDLGRRLLDTDGALRMSAFKTGSLTVTSVRVPKLKVTNSDLRFSGSVRYGGAAVAVDGTVAHFHKRSATTLNAAVTDADVALAVEHATGKPSPLVGKFDATLLIRSGGDIPAGAGLMRGSITINRGVIPLGDGIKPFIKDLLRVVPYLRVSDDAIALGQIKGEVQFSRGAFQLDRLTYDTGGRTLHLRGYVDSRGKSFVFRVPPKKNSDAAGVGVVVEGIDKLRVRLASRGELLDDDPNAGRRAVAALTANAATPDGAPAEEANMVKRLFSGLKRNRDDNEDSE